MVAEIPPPDLASPAPDLPPPTPPATVGSSWDLAILLVVIALAATSLLIVRRLGLHRIRTVRTGHLEERDELWMILGIAGLLLLLANWLGSGSAAQILANAGPVDPYTLRIMALLSLGGCVGTILALIVIPVIVPGVLAHIGFRARARDLLTGTGAALLIFPLVLVTNAAMRALAGVVASLRDVPPPDNVMHETLDAMLRDPFGPWWWLLVALSTLATPLYEETLFRGFLQTVFLRVTHTPRLAIVVTSVIFTAMHIPVVEWHGLPGIFLLSIALGIIMERTGRLAPAIIIHALFNAGNIAIAVAAAP
ncbi:MAG: CPBP family intramembrane metalloprotease [Phycisphaerales bacterium]|nr:CPBP family intramembrane metalloprotease [Phycisphaerales bacterium]